MFIRKFQRGISVVAIAACAPMVFGCATTNRYVVDPGHASSVTIEAAVTWKNDNPLREMTTRFDTAGGDIDPVAMTISGTNVDGESVVVPLAKVTRISFRGTESARKSINASPAPLIEGAGWRPDGQVQYVALCSGEVVDVRRIPTTVDAEKRLLNCAPADGAASAIPFDQIAYVQITNTHPGRTFLCILGGAMLALCIGVGIAMADWGGALGYGGASGW
jgi:hypothetical protein